MPHPWDRRIYNFQSRWQNFEKTDTLVLNVWWHLDCWDSLETSKYYGAVSQNDGSSTITHSDNIFKLFMATYVMWYLADFPAVFFHICNICHEMQIPKDENKSRWSRATYYVISHNYQWPLFSNTCYLLFTHHRLHWPQINHCQFAVLVILMLWFMNGHLNCVRMDFVQFI